MEKIQNFVAKENENFVQIIFKGHHSFKISSKKNYKLYFNIVISFFKFQMFMFNVHHSDK